MDGWSVFRREDNRALKHRYALLAMGRILVRSTLSGTDREAVSARDCATPLMQRPSVDLPVSSDNFGREINVGQGIIGVVTPPDHCGVPAGILVEVSS